MRLDTKKPIVQYFRFHKVGGSPPEYIALSERCMDIVHDTHPGVKFGLKYHEGSIRHNIGGIQVTEYIVEFTFTSC